MVLKKYAKSVARKSKINVRKRRIGGEYILSVRYSAPTIKKEGMGVVRLDLYRPYLKKYTLYSKTGKIPTRTALTIFNMIKDKYDLNRYGYLIKDRSMRMGR